MSRTDSTTRTADLAGLSRAEQRAEARRAVRATFMGTTIEWYDFYLYAACAALIFGPQFFPSDSSTASQLGAFASFAFGFIARPLGGILAGHFGDRVGRKKMLILSLTVMGIVSTFIGLLPSYEQIGVAAPILLVVLRLVQGLAVGAEWGGAVTMAVEHAPANRKALYGAAPMMGLPAGLLLSSLVLIVLGALTGPAFIEWGWRIAFLFSVLLVVLSIWYRRRLTESPIFEASVANEPKALPLMEVLCGYKAPLGFTIIIAAVPPVLAYLVLTWALSYGTTSLGYDRNDLLWIGILCCVIQLIMMPYLATVVDRTNPRILAGIGAVLMSITAIIFFPLFETGNLLLAGIATVAAHASTSFAFAAIPPILTQAFPSRIRYTGVSMAYQFGSILGGGFAPMIATTLFAATGQTWPIGLYVVTASVLMLLSIAGLGLYYRAQNAARRDAASDERQEMVSAQ
ncbi:MAG TPA: MHS family MFS transporter [Candidatus Yaniella excrementavium]|nr:MHS family MFS transporter [Candidatus Yaniella excrementavium]